MAGPGFSLPFVIQTDASDYGLGAVLTQQHPDGEHAISFISCSLSPAERKYSTTEKECLAVVWAIEKFRPYVEGTRFKVITDHFSLLWLHRLKNPSGRLARWGLRLQAFDFDIEHRKGKENLVPDFLSRSVPKLEEISVERVDGWLTNLRARIEKSPQKFPAFRIDNGQIFKHVRSRYPVLTGEGSQWKLVVPKGQRNQRIQECHDEPTSGHLGVFKTVDRLAQSYYWPKMEADVARYISKCQVCLQHKPVQQAPIGPMVTRYDVVRPWQVVAMDLMGPLPKSSGGWCYILVVVDTFSKYCVTFPLRTATAQGVVRLVEDGVILVFGAPTKIIVDNGVQFKSRAFQTLATRYHIKVTYTAHYHPQANPTERVNRVIKTMLASYVADNQRNWDKYLQKVTCCIRTSKHEATGYTPFFINFGREILLSGLPKGGPQLVGVDLPLDPRQKANELARLYEEVRERLAKAANKGKKYYDLRRRTVTFQIGQRVWRKNYALSNAANYFTAKFAPKYVGPFIIHNKLSPWTYELKNPDDGRLRGCWHAKDLKPDPGEALSDDDERSVLG